MAALAVGGPVVAEAQCLAARPGSPFNFAAGANTIFQTDFTSEQLGAFPATLEFKQGAMEVADWQGKRALKASSPSALAIPLTGPLPQAFTVELSVVNRNTKQVGAYTVKIYGGRNFLSDFATAATRANYGTLGWEVSGGGTSAEGALASDDAESCIGQEQTIRLLVNGPRLELYADQRRLASVPNANFLRGRGLVIALEGRDDAENAVYLTSIRVAGATGTVAQGSTPATTPTFTAPTTSTSSIPTASSPTATPATTPLSTAPTSAPPTTTTTTTAAIPTTTPTSAAPTTSTTAATKAGVAPTGTAPSKASLASSDTMAAPTGVTATPLIGGIVRVRWDAMPGALGYTIMQQLTNGQFAGANPINVPEFAGTDTAGHTIELVFGPRTLAVVARYDGGMSPPSTPINVDIPRWYGTYRLSILGFKVDQATSDDPLETDGKRDEVYVRAAIVERDANGQIVNGAVERRSLVHGDINTTEWRSPTSPNRRIKAGRASTDGGLMTNDGFPTDWPWQRSSTTDSNESFPLFLWEGVLYQGMNHVQVAMQVWESDQRPGQGLLTFSGSPPEVAALDPAAVVTTRLDPLVTGQVLTGVVAGVVAAPAIVPLLALSAPALAPAVAAGILASKISVRLPAVPRVSTPLDSLSFYVAMNSASLGLNNALASVPNVINQAVGQFFLNQLASWQLQLNTQDRPVGIRKDASGRIIAVPRILTLTFENAEMEALAGNGPSTAGVGVYPIKFVDAVADQGGNGAYTLYVQVQRIR